MGLILSGVQPTGNLHLGNYLGAIKNWVSLQNEHKCLFMLADLHAITVKQNPQELRDNVLKVAALYIACGIDPKKSVIFTQSRVSGHAELAWVLGCNTPMGWLKRMTQFKDKAGIDNLEKELRKTLSEMGDFKNKYFNLTEGNYNKLNIPTKAELYNAYSILEDKIKKLTKAVENSELGASLGLFGYPVLMAADILLYNATHVPVGEDQKQHLELARDIAGKFNREFGSEFFTIPEPLIMKTGARVMSLQDATKKMSKSGESEYSRINLTDSADIIAKKVKSAKTDATPEVTYDPATRPDVSTLIELLAVLRNETPQIAAKSLEGQKSSGLKAALTEALISTLEPITAEYNRLINDRIMLMKVLDEGAAKANDIARANFAKVKEIVGFI